MPSWWRCLTRFGTKRQRALYKFLTNSVYPCDIKAYWDRFTNETASEFPEKLELRLFFVTDRGFIHTGSGYFSDAPYTFALTANKAIIAGITFDTAAGKVVYVVQIQARRHGKEILKGVRWERMLLQVVVDWARQNGFKKVMVQPANQNQYYSKSLAQRFKLRYDVTAQRSGFRFDPTYNAHCLELI